MLLLFLYVFDTSGHLVFDNFWFAVKEAQMIHEEMPSASSVVLMPADVQEDNDEPGVVVFPPHIYRWLHAACYRIFCFAQFHWDLAIFISLDTVSAEFGNC